MVPKTQQSRGTVVPQDSGCQTPPALDTPRRAFVAMLGGGDTPGDQAPRWERRCHPALPSGPCAPSSDPCQPDVHLPGVVLSLGTLTQAGVAEWVWLARGHRGERQPRPPSQWAFSLRSLSPVTSRETLRVFSPLTSS